MTVTIPVHRRNQRTVHFIGLLKTGNALSAPAFCKWLSRHQNESVCAKTVKRDIAYLREELGAPIEYDSAQKGYVLYDPEWTFPFAMLPREELFAAVLSESLVRQIIPPPLNSLVDSAMRVQLAAGEPDKIDPRLFSSVAIATSSRVAADFTEIFQTVSHAWRTSRRLRLSYRSANADCYETRDVDVHALFLADGAWYARVYCHLRGECRSLALHRVRNPKLLDDRFNRSEQIAQEIQSGRVFDYDTVENVIIMCDQTKASIIREREWFPGQTIHEQDDGKLLLTVPEAPRLVLIWWVLSYAGHLTVKNPPEIVREIHAAAQKILQQHPAQKDLKNIQQGQELSCVPHVE